MKLTRSDREAFVRAVMNDVPAVDYAERFREMANKEAVKLLPKAVKALYDDTSLRAFVACEARLYGIRSGVTTFGPSDHGDCIAEKLKDKRAGMLRLYEAQREARKGLEQKVASVIASCTTLKQAHERLPEFAKYLPTERDGTGVSSLPVVANVVADLSKAGWPKGKEARNG